MGKTEKGSMTIYSMQEHLAQISQKEISRITKELRDFGMRNPAKFFVDHKNPIELKMSNRKISDQIVLPSIHHNSIAQCALPASGVKSPPPSSVIATLPKLTVVHTDAPQEIISLQLTDREANFDRGGQMEWRSHGFTMMFEEVENLYNYVKAVKKYHAKMMADNHKQNIKDATANVNRAKKQLAYVKKAR